MKSIISILVVTLSFSFSIAQSVVPSAEQQIQLAVLAAPLEKRDGAAVLGYAKDKKLVELRKGSNEMICLADNPDQAGFSVSCYHRDLEPFMARGRELKMTEKNTQVIFDTREKEVKAGTLKMPAAPSTLFVLTAPEKDYDVAAGEVKNTYLRYVIYIPYATSETTGLPLKPASPGMPWIMFPGTHGAHIMISPPAQK